MGRPVFAIAGFGEVTGWRVSEELGGTGLAGEIVTLQEIVLHKQGVQDKNQ